MKRIQKISIIGAGAIGTQTALYLQQDSIYYNNNLREIILYNHNSDLAVGESADIIDSVFFHQLFSHKPTSSCKIIPSSNIADIYNSDVIIVSVGVKGKTIENSDRLSEIHDSYYIIKNIGLAIKQYSKNSLVIMITNPVDILTWYMQEISGLPQHKVIGIGVALDSARYAYNLKEEFVKHKIDVKSIEALVIGAHSGRDMLMLESKVKVNDQPVERLKESLLSEKDLNNILHEAEEKTYERGFFIVRQKRQRSASISPAAIAATISLAYVSGETIKIPLSLVVNIKDLQLYNSRIRQKACIGVMVSISSKVTKIEKINLSEKEKFKFYKILKKLILLKHHYDLLFNNEEKIDKNLSNNQTKKYFFIEEKTIQYINIAYNCELLAHNDNLCK